MFTRSPLSTRSPLVTTSPRWRDRTVAVAAVGVLAVSLAACGGETEGGAGTPVTFGVIGPQLLGSAYFSSVPTYLGYWSGEGIDVEFNEFNGSGEAMTAVATDRTLIGLGGTSSVMSAQVNGDAEIKSFYSYIPNTPYWPVVLPDSPIQSIEDMQGATVGTFSLAGDGASMFTGVMKQQGLDTASVDIVEVGTGATAIQALETGRIDAYLGYDSVYAEIESLGFGLRKIDSPMDDYGFMGGLTAQPATFQNQRQVLVALGRGVAKATTFIKANPECALRIHWEEYPESKLAGVPEQEALERGLVGVMARLGGQFPVDEQWGRVTPETVQKRIDVAQSAGLLSREVAVEDIWDPALLDEINDFDVAAVEQQARTCDLDALAAEQ